MLASQLRANELLSSEGVKPHGMGFVIAPDEAAQLGLGSIPDLDLRIRPYRNGRDLTEQPRNALIIDLHGLGIEEVRETIPCCLPARLTRVKPERDTNSERYRRENWWLFGAQEYRAPCRARGNRSLHCHSEDSKTSRISVSRWQHSSGQQTYCFCVWRTLSSWESWAVGFIAFGRSRPAVRLALEMILDIT